MELMKLMELPTVKRGRAKLVKFVNFRCYGAYAGLRAYVIVQKPVPY